VQEVAADIKRYCDAHPDARDTLEGIAWWLAFQRAADERDVLEAAMAYLIERQVMTSHRLNDGTILFGCSGCAANGAAGAQAAAKDRDR
jgi:hypothetical protein